MKHSNPILFLLFAFATLFSFNANASTYYWVGNGGNWSQYNTHWATTSGGLVFYNQSPSQNDDVIFDVNSFTLSGQTVGIDGATVDCKSFLVQPNISNNPDFIQSQGNTYLRIFGSLTLQNAIGWSFTSIINMMAPSGQQTIKCAGHGFQELDFNANATWSQTDSLRTLFLKLNNGTFKTNNFSLNADHFIFGTSQYNTFLAGTSILYCNSWDARTYSYSNIDADSAIIHVTEFFTNSAGRHFYKLIAPSFAPNLYIFTDSCTIDSIFAFSNWTGFSGRKNNIRYLCTGQHFAFVYPNHYQYAEMRGLVRFDQSSSSDFDTLFLNNPGSTVSLDPYVVLTINNLLLTPNNACADLIYINSTFPGQQCTFYKATGSITCNGISLQDCNATGGAVFTANNSFNLGNVSGWIVNNLIPRTYYWVGNNGNWFDGLHWATTSGGVAGVCVPNSHDSIVFDQNSFSGSGDTVTIDHDIINIKSLNALNVIYPFTIFSAVTNYNYQQIYCSQNFQLSKLVNWGYQRTRLYMVALSGINTLQVGGNNIAYVEFNGNGTWNFLDSANITQVVFNNGHLNLRMNYLQAGDFYAASPSSGSLNLGSAKLAVTNFSLSPGTMPVAADSCKIFVGSSYDNENNCVFDSVSTVYGNPDATMVSLVAGTIKHLVANTYTYLMNSGGLVKEVRANKRLTINAINGHIENLDARNNVFIFYDYTIDTLRMNNPNYSIGINVGQTLNINDLFANGSCSGLLTIESNNQSAFTDQAILHSNSTSINADEILLRNIAATGSANFIATNSISNGHVTGWNITQSTSPQTYYWVNGSGKWCDSNHWSLSSGGSPSSCVPGIQDDVIFDINSFTGNDTVNFLDQFSYCHNITCTGFTVHPVFMGTIYYYPTAFSALSVSGSMHMLPNINWIYEGQVIFIGNERNRQVGGAGLPFMGVQFNGKGGSWILSDSLKYLHQFIQYRGSINTSGQTIRGYDYFDVSDSLWLGTSNIIIDQALFNAPTSPTWTGIIDADSAFISCGNINGYNLHIHHLNFDGYPASNSSMNIPLSHIDLFTSLNVLTDINTSDTVFINHAIIGGPGLIESPVRINYCDFRNDFTTIRNIVFDTLILNNPSYATHFAADSNTIVNNKLFTNGNASFPINFMSSNPGTQANIIVPTDTVCMEYVNFQDINASGGAVFYAGFYSLDLGNNSGLNFTACQIPMSNVWPGDANNDLTVDNNDVLNVGLAFNETGFVRPGATTSWNSQPCVDWNRIFGNFVNISHADCDGNGTIDSTDLTAVYLNYGQTHPPIVNPNGSNNGYPRSGADLFLDPTTTNYSPGDFVSIPVKLGTPSVPANLIYGAAYKITYDNSKIVNGSINMTYPSTWFTPNGNRVSFQKDNFPSGRIDDSQTRTNLTNVSGDGSIAYLHFQITPTAAGSIVLDITGINAVDNLGNPVTLMPIGTTLSILPLAIQQNSIAADVQVFPNPTNGNSTLTYSIQQKENVHFEIYDVSGKVIYSENKSQQTAGEYSITLPMEKLSNGIYFCRFTNGEMTATLKIVKTE